MKLSRRQLLQVSLLCLCNTAVRSADGAAESLGNNHAYPGGIIELDWEKTSPEIPVVKFGLEEPAVIDGGNHWRILIGLSLDTLPGDYVIYIKDPGSELPGISLTFSVKQKFYPVTEQEEELKQFKDLPKPLSLLDFKNTTPPRLPFRLPVEGEWQADFGRIFTHRIPNDSSPSVTQDFYVIGTNEIRMVVAPQNGIICRIDQNDQNSPAQVVIDHGRGVFTVLDGVDDLSVELGNGIVGGAAIGRLKPTSDTAIRNEIGLVNSLANASASTSPLPGTLHWYCVMNHALVDPIILTL